MKRCDHHHHRRLRVYFSCVFGSQLYCVCTFFFVAVVVCPRKSISEYQKEKNEWRGRRKNEKKKMPKRKKCRQMKYILKPQVLFVGTVERLLTGDNIEYTRLFSSTKEHTQFVTRQATARFARHTPYEMQNKTKTKIWIESDKNENTNPKGMLWSRIYS